MNESVRFKLTEKVIAGGFLILLGALFTLDNLGVINAGDLWDYWPLFLIVPGLARLARPTWPGQRLGGAILVALGSVFLLRTLDIVSFPFHRIWPAALLALGAYLIWQALSRGGPSESGPTPPPGARERAMAGAMAAIDATRGLWRPAAVTAELHEFALFGGGQRIVRSSDFRGGHVTAIAGGFDIDLREASMTGASATVEVFVLMGGAVFRVPESWNVVLNVTPVLGGTDYKARTIHPPGDTVPKTLSIQGLVVMGGIEIKN